MDKDRLIEVLRRQIRSLERTAALGYLVSAVVHEINNPLSVILIGADTLRHSGSHPEPVKRHLDVLNQQSDRIVHISRRMQELSRENLGGLGDVDLREVLQWFVDQETEFAGPEGPPTLTMPDDVLPVRADPVQLHQVLRYVSRAVQSLAGGGPVQLEAGTEEVRLIQVGPAAERSPLRRFAVTRIRVGEVDGEFEPYRKHMPDFFGEPRTEHEVELMASWEVIRKLSGKLQMRVGGETGGVELQIMIPRMEELPSWP